MSTLLDGMEAVDLLEPQPGPFSSHIARAVGFFKCPHDFFNLQAGTFLRGRQRIAQLATSLGEVFHLEDGDVVLPKVLQEEAVKLV